MWKTLRNLVLAAVLVAGVLKLLAWYAVGHDLPRVLSQLTPYARINYGKLSTDLNGDITLTNVQIRPADQNGRFHADRLTFSGPNLFWLIRHSLLHDNNLPDAFSISVKNLVVPTSLPWLGPPWLDTRTFVPFPALGCGVTAFGPADYHKMDLRTGASQAQLDYQYDDAARKLYLGLVLSVPGISRSSVKVELGNFNPQQISSAAASTKLHVEQISVAYADLGYLKHRTRYCAHRQSISGVQFVNEHVAAVLKLLNQYGIHPSNALTLLYRRLLLHGGSASALSLPTRDFTFGNWHKIGRDAAWRQLNVTVRYRTTPPIMFGLQFDPEQIPAAPTSAASVAATQVVSVSTPRIAAVRPRIDAPSPVQAPPPLQAPVLPAPHVASTPSTSGTRRSPIPAKSPQPKTSRIDRQQKDSRLPVVPSSPRPPPDSTLALVWKPTIDAMPAPPPPKRDYTVIGFDQLSHEIGHRVRLLTGGDNKVVGVVVGVDRFSVRLRVEHGDGSAKFDVARSRIRQIQLLRQ